MATSKILEAPSVESNPRWTLTAQDFKEAAQRLKCSVEVVKAVTEVESAGNGFCPDRFPKTLFEGHYFSKFTKGKYDASHPTISYPKWVRTFYGKTWQEERARLDQATALDRQAALMSASWGAFQIMGSNFAASGFKNVQEFVNAMCRSAGDQLQAFVSYVIENGLADELRDKRWADFARHYNGPGQVSVYAARLTKAYNRLVSSS